jgi:hypothetical protein
LFYIAEIFNHTHAVFCPISLVQVLQPGTGVLLTFKTVGQASCFYILAIFYMAPEAGYGLELVIATAPGTNIFLSGISAAKAAVHPAGSDQCCFDRHCILRFY